MSRPRHNPKAASVSLFPFLAVLLCTMGALVMLLVAMAHVSRAKAQIESQQAAAEVAANEPSPETLAEPAEAPPAVTDEQRELAEQRKQQLAEVEEAIAKLTEQHTEVDRVLREDQLRLSQTEDHIRRLVDQLESKRAAIAELVQQDAEHYDDRAQAERNLKQLETLIADTKAEIEELEKHQTGRQKSYSLVPYAGENGTRRQPIYIECVDDKVLLQPEGVVLTPADFEKPLGVGNPLAAALRASREYYARQNPDAGFDPDAEPYPLIIVRPSGVRMYYGVRRGDPQLGFRLRIRVGRRGLEAVIPGGQPRLESATVTRHRPSPRAACPVSSRGAAGLRRSWRRRLPDERPRRWRGRPRRRRLARRRHRWQPLRRIDSQFLARRIATNGGGLRSRRRPASDGRATRFGARRRQVGRGTHVRVLLAAFVVQIARRGNFARARSVRQGRVPPGHGQPRRWRPLRVIASKRRPPLGRERPGWRRQSSSTSGSGDSSSIGRLSGSSSSAAGQRKSGQRGQSGEDWALSKRSPSDIAIRRNIRVLVRGDRLELLTSSSSRARSGPVVGSTVYLDGATEEGVRELIDEVQSQIKSWGMAGQGLYWRPVLLLDVAADGGARARDLSRLLESSGIDISYDRTAKRRVTGGNDATR